MKNFHSKLVFVFLISVVALSACGKSEPANQKTNAANQAANTNTNLTQDDTEEFAKVVNLPFQPEEVTWRETKSKKLLAVLKFSTQDAQALTAQVEKRKPATPTELDAENWFPPELIAKSEETGDEILKGNTYPADDFFSESYKSGKITRISGTNYFILEMSNP